MRIIYDPKKRDKTLADRGLDFEHAAEVFAGTVLNVPDMRVDYGEDRYNTYGLLHGRMVAISWTQRGELCRIISMRKCNEREQARYAAQLAPSDRRAADGE
jgi:uncharacterized DUF497 family protein